MEKPLIIFDLVATLTNAGPRYAEAYIRMCRHWDVTPPSHDDILQALGNKNLKQIIAEYTPELPVEQIGRFMAECNQACDSLLYDVHWHEDLYPHVRQALTTLHDRGYALGIYTGTRDDALTAQLRYHNVLDYFDPRFVRAKNNDRDGFLNSDDLKAAQLQSIAAVYGEPKNIIVVGDSASDVKAAAKAGLHHFIGFAVDGKKAESLSGAGARTLFGDFADLPDLIGRYRAQSPRPVKRSGFGL